MKIWKPTPNNRRGKSVCASISLLALMVNNINEKKNKYNKCICMCVCVCVCDRNLRFLPVKKSTRNRHKSFVLNIAISKTEDYRNWKLSELKRKVAVASLGLEVQYKSIQGWGDGGKATKCNAESDGIILTCMKNLTRKGETRPWIAHESQDALPSSYHSASPQPVLRWKRSCL